jgi:ATP-dependent RNA helicase RhlE
MRFSDLPLIQPILEALHDVNYVEPTEIQQKAIPVILDKRDIMGSAQTGTGKTAAFAIPIIQHIYKSQFKDRMDIKALIVTPTRELAIQIDENISDYSKYTQIRHAVIYGGVKQGRQVERLKKGVHILVATPGRLLDLIDQGFVNLKNIDIFVLDEADRMLDMGFIHDIRRILKLLPAQRQSLFFSATMPESIVALSRKILNNPVKIDISPESTTAETIQQYIYYTNKHSKKELLYHILEDPKIDQVLLFARTKHGADKLVRNLKEHRIHAAAIHGNKAQTQRQKVLSEFKDGKLRVLVATDIAARGIDIDKLKYVINFDIPEVAETYVHRIGRSGRAGEVGTSISLSEPEENAAVRDIEKLINLKIDVVKDHPFPQTEKPMTEAEKKEFNKEKQRKKQEFFANRKNNKRR